MDLSVVDRSATLGTSTLHRVVPHSKLVAAALLIAAVMISVNLLVVASITAVLFAVVVGLRLRWRPLLTLALYPGIFGALYAFAGGIGLLSAALIITKAITSALVVLILMFTTPYPQVFAPMQRFLPAVIGDALLMTYRSLFLLLEKFSHTLTAARLRAGIVGASPVRSAATITRSLGGVLLYSIDLSQRTHDIMHLRGYDGRLVVTPLPSQSPASDRSVVAIAAAIALTAAAWRIWWPVLNPYAWLPLAAALLLLAAALLSTLPRGA